MEFTKTIMSIYILIDIIILLLISYFSILSYEKKYYLKIFEYVKIVVLLTISAKLAPYSGKLLEKFYILSTDTYMVLLLLSFCINFVVFYLAWKYIFKLADILINSQSVKRICAIIFTIFEVTLILTFTLFVIMQLYISKKYLYSHFMKSYTYSHIHRFYDKFLNDDFVNMILNSNTSGINHKEVIYKSFQKSL